MKIFGAALLFVSLVLNAFLFNRMASHGRSSEATPPRDGEMAESQVTNPEFQTKQTSGPESTNTDARELARLRNEVSQVRQQAAEALRNQAAEAEQLRARLGTATQQLARAEKDLADAVRIPPEQLRELKDEAHSIRCVSNMKQIGLAARIWANEHQDIFPPDFLTMKDELNTPRILFCPGDTAVVQVAEWSQLNPTAISYRFLNPNGNESDPSRILTTCPVHGHVGLSDGSVQRKQ